MTDMIKIDVSSRVPIHEQIKNRLKELVLKRMLKPGDALPSAVTLAEALKVAPSAVTRAYRELTKDKFLLEDHTGIRVSQHAEKQARSSVGESLQDAIEALRICRDAGVDWERIEALIQILKRDDSASKELASSVNDTVRGFQVAERPDGDRDCPFCKQAVGEDERTATCMVCGTVHHLDCWNEASHCSIFGCSGRLKLPL